MLALVFSPALLAYSYQGHQLIGAIADQQLHDAARQKVRTLLGFELRAAAPWPDCVRSVKADGNGAYTYTQDPQHPEYEVPCAVFDTPEERARMEDYVRRNWDNCADAPVAGCHSTYHYTNVAFQHERYNRAYIGTSDHDIVGAINAAIAVLQDRPAPPPFSIKDKKEALFLLAHFVGDLHQPLHVGAAYLGSDNRPFDPDALGQAPDPRTGTRGGNLIRDEISKTNLHSDWDQMPSALSGGVDRALSDSAHAVARTPGPVTGWAVIWAGETLRLSRSAYIGLRFVDDPALPGQWLAQFADHAAYWKHKEDLQKGEIVRAGARLAQLLDAIWPTTRRPVEAHRVEQSAQNSRGGGDDQLRRESTVRFP
ncbi:MAG: Nuclease [Hydrocarboniphaga sp.]|uniref:S1/P1 nuclease n=1 Tax=Hydrocarboniphaga sp. TaxID=2033016 RepID=UPI002609D134|nr:S1/P1 nuclease [Hydrocarboniphaga sp.]MDB5968784.1 Nuclease [Hydrocarboniphaga sp.]